MGMLYEICPICEGEGTLTTGDAIRLTQPCPGCKPLRVVQTGATAKQLEAAVGRARRYEDALRAVADAVGGPLPQLESAIQAAREALTRRGRSES